MEGRAYSALAVSLLLGRIAGPALAGELSGAVFGTLTKASSPYTVTSDITVPASQSLTIEAGVELRFKGNVSFFVDGTLTAIGTVTDSIRFTSNQGQPQTGDWNGIIYRAGSSGEVRYAVLEYAATGLTATGAAPTVSRSHMRNNNNGIDCFAGSNALIKWNLLTGHANSAVRCNASNPTILGNVIRHNDALDAAISCDAAAPVIQQNVVRQNGSSAVDCINGSTAKIWHNTLVGNQAGVTITDSNVEIKSNLIGLNTFGIQNDGGLPVVAYNDVWGNASGNFQGMPAGVGDLTTTNANGDPADAFGNIQLDPLFVDAGSGDYQLQSGSPAIDAGDPGNPAAIPITGNAPDQGAFEFESSVPVELVSFAFEGGVLRWTTASETNNFGFEVQRSDRPERGFRRISFVPGAGTTTVPQRYAFRDSLGEGVLFYRLKQIDLDGTFTFSPVVRAVYEGPRQLQLLQNFPNPFNPSTTIRYRVQATESGSQQPAPVAVRVFNALGQEVAVLFEGAQPPGRYELVWNGTDRRGQAVPSGAYFYRLEIGGRSQTRKMVLSR